jgi:predicted transcriptional regulator
MYFDPDRLKAIMAERGISATRFCRMSGLKSITVNRALGGFDIRPETMRRILETLEIEAERAWLDKLIWPGSAL